MMKTRKPTGKPCWPLILLAGVEKAGKTYAAAEASASALIDRTFWVTVGEDDPDEYGTLGRFEIVDHDGTYRGILGAIREASAEPARDRPHLIVLDSGTRLWDLLKDEAQATANARAKKRGRSTDEADITADLWNVAKTRWAHIITALKDHHGPAIITARLDQTMVVNGDGQPTKERVWKVQAEKTLPYDVGAIVQMRGYRDAYLTGVRSIRYRPGPNEETPYPHFTVADLWAKLGIEDAGERSHVAVSGAASMEADEKVARNRAALLAQIGDATPDRAKIAADWMQTHGHPIAETDDIAGLMKLRDQLTTKEKP